MLSRVSSENPYYLIAQREILSKILFELGNIKLNSQEIYKSFNQSYIEKLFKNLNVSNNYSDNSELLQELTQDKEYLEEMIVGCIYSLAYSLNTFPADYSKNGQLSKNKNQLFAAGATEVDEPEKSRIAEDAFESCSGLTFFRYQDLDSWKAKFTNLADLIYQEFIYSSYLNDKKVNIKNTYVEVITDIIQETNFLLQKKINTSAPEFKKLLLEISDEKTLPSKLSEFQNSIIEKLKQLLNKSKEPQVEIKHYLYTIKNLHKNFGFLKNTPNIADPAFSQKQFRNSLRSYLNSKDVLNDLPRKLINDFKKGDISLEVRCPIFVNLYEAENDKYSTPDLSSIEGMQLKKRTLKKDSEQYELVLPKLTGHTINQILNQARILFNFAIDLMRLSESTPPEISKTGGLNYKNLKTNHRGSTFKAIHKPWLSDFDKRMTNFIEFHSQILHDNRPICERFRRSIKLYNDSKTNDDPYMRLTLTWAMFLSLVDNENNILKYLPLMHFYGTSGPRFNNLKSKQEKQRVKKFEVLRFRSELTQIKESKEILNDQDHNQFKRNLMIQAAADGLDKYRESAIKFITYASFQEKPKCDDIYEFITLLEKNLEKE